MFTHKQIDMLRSIYTKQYGPTSTTNIRDGDRVIKYRLYNDNDNIRENREKLNKYNFYRIYQNNDVEEFNNYLDLLPDIIGEILSNESKINKSTPIFVLINEEPNDEWIKLAAITLVKESGCSMAPILVDSVDHFKSELDRMQIDSASAVLLYMVNCSTERIDAFVKFPKLDRARNSQQLKETIVIGVRSMNDKSKMIPIVSRIDNKVDTIASRGLPLGTCFFYARTEEFFPKESSTACNLVRKYACQ